MSPHANEPDAPGSTAHPPSASATGRGVELAVLVGVGDGVTVRTAVVVGVGNGVGEMVLVDVAAARSVTGPNAVNGERLPAASSTCAAR